MYTTPSAKPSSGKIKITLDLAHEMLDKANIARLKVA